MAALSLTGLFSLLEFVEQLASVGQGRYHVTDAFVYVLLTAPSRLMQVTSISMLLGSLLALGALARNSEITAMLSLGIPEHRIIRSVLQLTVPISVALFLLAEFVIPSAQQLAHARRNSALSSAASFHTDDSLWAQSDRQFLNVKQFGRDYIPIGIDIYAFATDGSLESLIHADRATIKPDGIWLLTGVSRKRAHSSQLETDHLASLPWRSFISPQQMRFLVLPLDSIPPIALYRHIFSVERRHETATRYEQEFWAKVSIPLSMVAMIMIASPFAFRLGRARSTGQSLTYGIGFGIVFSLSQQILDHMGLLFNLSPAVTATAPPLGVTVLAAYLLRRAYWPASRSGSLDLRRPIS